jgi:phosphoribosylcarboxyaminoimidazole (NCAIR) mutase
LLAVQILALSDEKLAAAHRDFRADQASAVEAKNRSLQESLK